jgi:hypothetical protein
MSGKSGRYVFVRADGFAVEANAGNFAALLGMLEPNFRTFTMPFVSIVHWAPGKKMRKPLPETVMAIIRRENAQFATVAWADMKDLRAFSIAVHGASDPWPLSKRTGRDVAWGRLLARLFEARGKADWRRL